MDVSVSLISLFAFIVVLGIVVDDAIVVVDAQRARGVALAAERGADVAVLDDDELDGALAKVRDLDDRGALDAWMREADRSRIGVGQITLLAAQ